MSDFVNYYTTLSSGTLKRAFGKDAAVDEVRYYLYQSGELQGETGVGDRGELQLCLDDDLGDVAYLGVKMTATQGSTVYVEEFWVLSAAEAEKVLEEGAWEFLFRCWREGCTAREDTLVRKGKGVVERTLTANYKLVRVRADTNSKVLFDLRKRSLEWDYTPVFKEGALVGFGVKDAFKLFGETGDGVWLRGTLYEYEGQTIYKFFKFEIEDNWGAEREVVGEGGDVSEWGAVSRENVSEGEGIVGTFWFYVVKV